MNTTSTRAAGAFGWILRAAILSSQLLLAAGSGVVAGWAGVQIWILTSGPDLDSQRIAFDAVAWSDPRKSVNPDRFCFTERQRMAQDLVVHVLEPGMERAQIHDKLGAPSRWPVFKGASWFGVEDEAWWLGHDPAFTQRDDDWLYIDFDASSRLIAAKVLRADASKSM